MGCIKFVVVVIVLIALLLIFSAISNSLDHYNYTQCVRAAGTQFCNAQMTVR